MLLGSSRARNCTEAGQAHAKSASLRERTNLVVEVTLIFVIYSCRQQPISREHTDKDPKKDALSVVIILRLFDLDANCLSRAANWRIGLGPAIGKWEWGWWRGTRDAGDGGFTRP
jgi:hypothetical protein